MSVRSLVIGTNATIYKRDNIATSVGKTRWQVNILFCVTDCRGAVACCQGSACLPWNFGSISGGRVKIMGFKW